LIELIPLTDKSTKAKT